MAKKTNINTKAGANGNKARVDVLKTYKIYIGGKFPRTESGRYYKLDQPSANICLGSRKDIRNAIVAARSAFEGWAGRPAFNRGQILYRIAEMLEGRKEQFITELVSQGSTKAAASGEVERCIDRLIYYTGWCDKYQQIFSSVNPVASAHFNFSVPEPMGVVAILADEQTSLLGLVSVVAPAIAGGNTCVVLASESKPLCAITFAEVLHTSDVPGGVVNIITGKADELSEHMALHMDVNTLVIDRAVDMTVLVNAATENMKRVRDWSGVSWNGANGQGPYYISDLQETKTTWHPVEQIGGAGSEY